MNRIKTLSLFKIWGVSLTMLAVASGCRTSDPLTRKVTPKTQEAETVNNPSALDSTLTKLTLTLDTPESLLIKQGDPIVKDQILVDRSAARQSLEVRRQKVQEQLVLFTGTIEVPIAPVNTEALVARVSQAKEQVRLQEAQLQKHYANSPYTEAARQELSLPAEEAKIRQLKGEIANAKAQLNQATTQLSSIQTVQRSRRQVETDSSNKKAQLTKELNTITTQLQSFQDILSPHDGIVQGIEWLKKGKEGYSVELALEVHSSPDSIPALSSSPNDPLLSPNPSGLTTGTQPFPNAPPVNPQQLNPQQSSTPLNLQSPAPTVPNN